MDQHSAAILLYRCGPDGLRVLAVHPGGPFWAKKDAGAWSLPKGEYAADEEPYPAARREFVEELGSAPPEVEPIDLGEIRQSGGKIVHAWALEGDFDVADLQSNEFEMEWPPRSGRSQRFPEVDRAGWFTADEAALRLNPAQAEFLDRLRATVGA